MKWALYKADISLRRTVYLGMDGSTVKLLWKISIKRTIIKRIVVRRTLFSCPKWTFCLKIISIKRTQVQKQLSRKKTCIFFEKLLFTMFYFLVYILNDFYHSVFCLLNCFDWSKEFKIYRNLESVTSTMIPTFSSYSTFYCTVRKC